MKLAELVYIGVSEGRYYFRERGVKNGPAYVGDAEDYWDWVAVQRDLPVTKKQAPIIVGS